MITTAQFSSEAPIDRAMILDRVGGDEDLLREITSIFLSEYPGLIEEIASAVASQDSKQLERAAHSLKGSVANFGARGATEAAYRLETIGRKGSLEEAPSALRDLTFHFQQLQPHLARLVL